MKQPEKYPKFVQIAESHCSDHAAEKMSEICVQLAGHCSGDAAEKCPDFVLDLQKVIAPMKQPKKCQKFVQLAEGHCSDNAAEKMSEICI